MSETQLTFDVLFDEDAHGAGVTQLAWRPASPPDRAEQLSGLWDDGDGAAWWLFDPQGSKTLLARPADFGVDEASEVQKLRWSEDGRRLLVVLGESFRLFDPEERRLVGLSGAETEVRGQDPRLSPDGRRIAYVRDADLHVLDLEGETTRVTDDGRTGVISNGACDWVYWEELWKRRSCGHWWNGDGTRLAYYRFDDAEVPVYTLVDTRPLYPNVEHQRYPKAGDTLPLVEVRVKDFASGRTVRLQTGGAGDSYLARVHWHPDGEQVAVERLNRDQTRLDVVLCRGGDGTGRVLATQEWPTWVNLGNEFRFLSDGRFLWSTEETGWRQLYLYGADGRDRHRLTPDGWSLVSLDAVGEGEGWFVFTAHATGPLGAAERHVFRGELRESGPAVHQLTAARGWHVAQVSPAGLWVEERSGSDTPARQRLGHVDRKPEVTLPRRAPSYDLARLPRWEHLTIPGPDGAELPAQVLKPSGLDPERRYPALMYQYGGPSSQVVDDRWIGSPMILWHRMMAERGYVVLYVDNVGSTFFGKHGEDKLHRCFGEHELQAQLAGVDYLKTLPWVDASRIGIWGWSGGGAATLYCLLRRPGVWKAGVAGAPVTDWRTYDAIWVERYLDHPRDNEKGYEESSPITHAAELRDELLLLHGTVDNNVHPQNTINMVQALIEAGVQFEMALYPNERHSLYTFDRRGQRHLLERVTAFFDRHLGR